MVCCILIAGLFGLLAAPFIRKRTSPLAWRLSNDGTDSLSPPLSSYYSRLSSFRYAIEGLSFTIRNEPNMRIHLVAAIAASIMGVMFEISMQDWRWLILAIGLVMAAEALNTAIEQCCNAISHEHHPIIKTAKDVAAGGVLICAISALLIGLTIFTPYLIEIQNLIDLDLSIFELEL